MSKGAMVQPEGTEKRTAVLLRFLRIIGLVDLGIVALVGLACAVSGWWTVAEYSRGLVWAGGTTIALGLASQLGGWGLTRSADVLLAQSTGQENVSGRTRLAARDLLRAYDFLITMAFAGLVVVGIGELVRWIWV